MASSINILCIRGTFHQLSVRPRKLSSTSVNFPCSRGTFCQHSMRPQVLPSTFCASTGPSVNFPCIRVIFHQLSVRQNDLSSICINFPCDLGKFRKFSVRLWVLPKTFHAATGSFVNFRASVDLLSTFRATTGPSVKYPCIRRTILQLSVHQRHLT